MGESRTAEATTGGYSLRWGGVSHRGNVRAVNEDAILLSAGVYLVADGMGGHGGGDVASTLLVDRFRGIESNGAPPLRIGEVSAVLQAANEDIRRYSTQAATGPIGTTVVGFVIAAGDQGAVPLVFHSGDSRAYRRAGGALERITADHSEVQEMIDAGLIDEQQARTHPKRNVITRSVGYDQTVVADFQVLDAAPMRIMLCSDGLTTELDDVAIDRALADSTLHPQLVAERLLAAALAGQARDNVSVVVVDFVPAVRPSVVDDEITVERPAPAGWAPRRRVDGSGSAVPV